MSPISRRSEAEPLLRPASPVPITPDRMYRNEDVFEVSKSSSTTSLPFKIAAAMYSFVVLGLFTSAIGVMLPPISKYYALNDLHVSFIFLVNPIGYILAAQSNSLMHSKFGQRGIAIISPIFHLLSAVIIAVHPPFSVLLLGFAGVQLGTGFLDGSWCAWAGSMEKANFVSGLLHGSYSVGAAIGPICAGAWMEKGREWWEWYYVLAAASIIEFIILAIAFRHENASRYRHSKVYTELESPTDISPSKEMLKYSAFWVSSAFFLTYVGNETAISGWIVSFMLRARHATLYLASLSSSGFWAGMAIGRLTLGHPTDRIGVRRATTMYLACAIALQIIFAFVRSTIASMVIMALLGFFMGPLFPSGIVVLTRLLPRELHVAAVSFVASLGQVGGAALPFAIGAFVETLGIAVFQWVVLVFTSIALCIWIIFARLKPKTHGSRNREQEEGITTD